MKIALIGYGNMGPEVEKVTADTGDDEVVSISFKKSTDKLDLEGIKKADVAIDFTSPLVVVENIEKIAKLGVNMVVGTTGWYKDLPKVKKIVSENKVGLIYGSNFSIGANMFFRIVEFASKLFNKYKEYDVYGLEIHHTGKKDSPSGTAKRLGDIVLKNFTRKKTLQNSSLQRQIKEEELHFASLRGGRNFGYHEITFDSQADSVRLSHQAHSRRGFAQGAIIAAKFIKGKKGIYSFDEIF